ncbi:Gfo/Idh/MocA family oxidoreductase [Gordonia sp. ABSL11-1]|uniref:Gfo/Idh/MocA family protein n=1 Tax=Gordonia sp. ABSL11-1 TaxID=3053924 RepID=UPI0025742B39|nr:Gfo/Idh/MocA family oxidoreductase [Gordonia sp. ABSL11-1]MDL9944615.1 Gfo/Idh/MocA family oxidoreductase [Gordonia sp. ABSL11-1]
MIRMALVGAGFIGSVHAANLASHPGVDLIGIHDVDDSRALELASRTGTTALGSDDVFDPSNVDAVLIASSTDTHATHLRRAAATGLATLCEKPIDLDLDHAVEVVGDVGHTGLPMMVDFNRRFDRDYAEVARTVRSGEIGGVELVQMTTRGPALPPLDYIAVSGGQMRDQTVHFFDLARWITGEDPVSVFAAGSVFTDPRMTDLGDVDTSVVTLRMPSGALVQIDSARRIGYGYDERIEVLGSTGLVEAGRHQVGSVTRYRAGQIVGDGMHAGWFERVAPTYRAALDHFVSAVETGTPIGPALPEALKAQAIAEAATRSLRTGELEPIGYPVPTSAV